jgi:phage-related protein
MTACLQQHTLLDQAGRIPTNTRGVPTPHPRKALIQDFSGQLRLWRSEGHELIISGDLNELLGDNPEAFGSITSIFNLTDVYRHLHGMDEPATFNGGHHRLDYIICTAPLLPLVTEGGILPFNILSHSDHRTVFVDFDMTLLFGSLPSELTSCKDPQFHSRDYEKSEQYVYAMHSYCHDHDVYRMAENVKVKADEGQLNRLEEAVGQAMEAGLKAVKKRYMTPFTPEMRQTRLVRTFYNLHMFQFKTGRTKSRSLKEVVRNMTSVSTTPFDQRDCHLQLKAVQAKIRKLRAEATQKRWEFLARRVNFESGVDEEKSDRIREMIQKAEDLREVCRKIRHVVKPGQAAELQTVLVPVDHPDPKKATVWKTIDDPQKVVAVLQARNKKHVCQAAGTPFSTGEFGSIPFDGSGPVADAVLAGTKKTADPVVQLITA